MEQWFDNKEVYLAAVCCKLAVKEEVHEVDLEENVDEVEELASKEAERIEVMILPATNSLLLMFSWCFWVGRLN